MCQKRNDHPPSISGVGILSASCPPIERNTWLTVLFGLEHPAIAPPSELFDAVVNTSFLRSSNFNSLALHNLTSVPPAPQGKVLH